MIALSRPGQSITQSLVQSGDKYGSEGPSTAWWSCLLQVYSSPVHTASVNSICFGPHELGLSLATASSDGSVAVLTHQQDGNWTTSKVRRWLMPCSLKKVILQTMDPPADGHSLGTACDHCISFHLSLQKLMGWGWHSVTMPQHGMFVLAIHAGMPLGRQALWHRTLISAESLTTQHQHHCDSRAICSVCLAAPLICQVIFNRQMSGHQ